MRHDGRQHDVVIVVTQLKAVPRAAQGDYKIVVLCTSILQYLRVINVMCIDPIRCDQCTFANV